MQADINELRELPLEQLISAPLNAVIQAQAQAAMTTVKFIETVGFNPKDEDDTFFDNLEDTTKNDYKVKIAKLHVDANGTVTNVDLPMISLFNIPNFEISNFDWSFNVKLKSMQSFSAKFALSNTTTTTATAEAGLNIQSFLKIGGSMKVESTTKTDFESRFKAGREQEYNLAISIKGISAPLPKGIATLLSIAENAAKTTPVPAP